MKNNSTVYVIGGLIVVAAIIGGFALLGGSGDFGQGDQGQARGLGADLVGKPMPEIALVDKDGRAYPMESLRGKKAVLFFNEGLMCYPACWNQMVAFASDPRFAGGDIAAISVVVDSPEDWQRAIAEMPDLAKAATLFDAGAAASRQLGILSMNSSMHAGQLPGHTYILIDAEGVVRDVFDDPNMGVNNDAIIQKLLAF